MSRSDLRILIVLITLITLLASSLSACGIELVERECVAGYCPGLPPSDAEPIDNDADAPAAIDWYEADGGVEVVGELD